MKRCVALLHDGWADWEAGPVLAALREHLGWSVAIASPKGETTVSIGGVRAIADKAFADVTVDDLDLLLAIGSEQWMRVENPEVYELLRQTASKGKPLGTICAANVATAKAGLLDSRAHTANSLRGLTTNVPAYRGADLYRDVPHAVSDQGVVTAAGSAPFTFAAEILKLADPAKGSQIASEFLAMSRAEFG